MEPPAERAPTGAPPVEVADPADEVLYTPFRRLGRSPERVVMLVGYGLILFQAVLRGWSKFGGWFLIDDLAFIGRAQTMDTWSFGYLFEGWLGHLMPGAFVLVAMLTDLDPWNYTPVAIVDLVGQAVLGLLVLRLLTSLFGRRPAVLVPFTIFALSPMTLPAFLWWAASLNQLWGQVAMALILLAHVHYHRTGRLRFGLAGAFALVGGLLFSEKTILMVPVVFAVSLLWFTPGPPLTRFRLLLSRSRAVWAAYAVVTIGYAVLYAFTARSPETKGASLTIAVETAGTGLVRAVLPALLGGPLTWQQIGVGGVAAPSDALTVLAMVVVILLVVVSIYRRARAVFGWVVIVGYVGVNAMLLGITRATIIGPLIGAEYRYHTDELLIFVVFGSLTLLPVVGTFAIGPFQRLLPRRPALRWAKTWTDEDRQRAEALVSGALAVVIAVMSTLSTVRFDPLWRTDVGRDYFANVEHDIARAGESVTILDTAVPNEVQNLLMAPRNSTSFLFAGMRPEPRFLTEGHPAQDQFYVPDDEGHLRRGQVGGFRNKPGPVEDCGWQVQRDSVTIPLDLTTVNWVWTARIGYLASLDAEADVTIGETTTRVPISAGAHTLYVVGHGAIGDVTVNGLTYGTLCTDDVEVGFATPVPGTGP